MDIRKKQRAVVDALEDIKGRDIVVFNTERLSPFFERVVVASGDSTRQVKALADNVQRKLKQLGVKVHSVEGGDTAEWVLVDLGDVIVHVMHPTTRLTYNLEELWGGKSVRMKRDADNSRPSVLKSSSLVKRKKSAKAPAKRKAKATPRKAAAKKKSTGTGARKIAKTSAGKTSAGKPARKTARKIANKPVRRRA
jgi:ribosome-associated protein